MPDSKKEPELSSAGQADASSSKKTELCGSSPETMMPVGAMPCVAPPVETKCCEPPPVTLVQAESEPNPTESAGHPIPVENLADTTQSINNARQVGNFTVGSLIGEGPCGKVFQSTNLTGGGDFAVKILPADFCRTEADRQRLLEGLKAAATVTGPNLASYYDCGCADGSVYLVADCLKGESLAGFSEAGESLPTDQIIDIFRQLCQALKCLHEKNLVHGNLKPSNIFLLKSGEENNLPKLVDFGLVQNFSQEQRDEFLRKSTCGERFLNYMSPEQCLGYSLDARSDIYSLGLVMYELLSGGPLVSAHSQLHAVMKQMNVKPCSLKDKQKDLPASIEEIIFKCLEKDRSARYFSVEDLLLALDLACAETARQTGSDKKDVTAAANAPGSDRKKRMKTAITVLLCTGALTCLSVGLAAAITAFPYLHHHGKMPRFRIPGSSEGLQRLAEAEINAVVFPEQRGRNLQNIRSWAWRGNGARFGGNLGAAAHFYGMAIDAHQREHPGAVDREFKKAHAAMQTRLGELLSRGIFADQGTQLDRSTFYTAYKPGENPPKLHPRFPGLRPSHSFAPDYVSAKAALDQAKKTLDGKFDLSDANLLWASCFVEFNLGNYDEAVKMQRELINVYQSQAVQNKETLILSYANLGRMYLWTGNPGKAVHEIKIARDIDRKTYKSGDGQYTEQVNADLAAGFLREGKFDVAAKIARDNLKRIALQSPQDAAMSVFNTTVLSQALRQLGKTDEADKLELQLYRSGQFQQGMP